MKYSKTTRQIAALERTLRSIEGYKKILGSGSVSDQAEFLVNVISNPTKVDEMSPDEVSKALKDKLTKAEKCVENLEAKGVTLEEN